MQYVLPHRSTERSDCDVRRRTSGLSLLFLTAVRRDPIATFVPAIVVVDYDFLTAVRRDPIATPGACAGWSRRRLPHRSTERSDCDIAKIAFGIASVFLTAVRRDPIATGHRDEDLMVRIFLTAVRRDPIATIENRPNGRRKTSSPQYGEIRLRHDVANPWTTGRVFFTAVRRDPIATSWDSLSLIKSELPHRSTERSDCDYFSCTMSLI